MNHFITLIALILLMHAKNKEQRTKRSLTENQPLGVLVVVFPQHANPILSAHVPNGEVDLLVLHSLYIEPNRWNGGDHLTQLN